MILSCGEAVIDMLPQMGADGAPKHHPVTGGAAVNTAVALARLEQPVGFFGGLSMDEYGQFLCQAMRAENISFSRCTLVESPTTLAFVELVDGSPRFTFQDSGSAGRSLSMAQIPNLQGIGALIFGGLSLIHRPAAGTFEALMQMAGPKRLILLDANIRPALIETEEESYRQRLTRMIAMADILKFSDEDIEWLRPDPPEQLLQGRASVVVHSHGANGVTAYSRHGAQHIPAPPVTVVDAVGAGDTFNAGFLASLAQQKVLSPSALALSGIDQINRAAAFGVRAATFSVTRAGANPPTIKDLQCAP
ncbi:fructokinase [Shimia gijangensis]|uniref:Fructokinase n=1 Tax=Shimia gijangensis TaxID=1470563 RepID=A0A1M6IVA1_9RHOB|nr:carbohydrate kinase [Shimia gijangensis]SHJ38362.1 fructokinase [Shimia gijangensis]